MTLTLFHLTLSTLLFASSFSHLKIYEKSHYYVTLISISFAQLHTTTATLLLCFLLNPIINYFKSLFLFILTTLVILSSFNFQQQKSESKKRYCQARKQNLLKQLSDFPKIELDTNAKTKRHNKIQFTKSRKIYKKKNIHEEVWSKIHILC